MVSIGILKFWCFYHHFFVMILRVPRVPPLHPQVRDRARWTAHLQSLRFQLLVALQWKVEGGKVSQGFPKSLDFKHKKITEKGPNRLVAMDNIEHPPAFF